MLDLKKVINGFDQNEKLNKSVNFLVLWFLWMMEVLWESFGIRLFLKRKETKYGVKVLWLFWNGGYIEGSKLKDFSLIAMFGWRWAQERGQRQVVYAKGGFWWERLLSCRYRIEGLGEKYYYLVGIELKDWERSLTGFPITSEIKQLVREERIDVVHCHSFPQEQSTCTIANFFLSHSSLCILNKLACFFRSFGSTPPV
jgi:hypothetical protein